MRLPTSVVSLADEIVDIEDQIETATKELKKKKDAMIGKMQKLPEIKNGAKSVGGKEYGFLLTLNQRKDYSVAYTKTEKLQLERLQKTMSEAKAKATQNAKGKEALGKVTIPITKEFITIAKR